MTKRRPPYQSPMVDQNGMINREWLLFLTLLSDDVAAWMPPSLADTDAANSTVYYSTTASKLVFKDSGGVVRNLY